RWGLPGEYGVEPEHVREVRSRRLHISARQHGNRHPHHHSVTLPTPLSYSTMRTARQSASPLPPDEGSAGVDPGPKVGPVAAERRPPETMDRSQLCAERIAGEVIPFDRRES